MRICDERRAARGSQVKVTFVFRTSETLEHEHIQEAALFWLACTQRSLLRSSESRMRSYIANRARAANETERLYTTIQQGQEVTEVTWPGQCWRARAPQTGAHLLEYCATRDVRTAPPPLLLLATTPAGCPPPHYTHERTSLIYLPRAPAAGAACEDPAAPPRGD